MYQTINFVTKRGLFWGEIRPFRAKSDNYGTCPEIGQLRIGKLKYNPCYYIVKAYGRIMSTKASLWRWNSLWYCWMHYGVWAWTLTFIRLSIIDLVKVVLHFLLSANRYACRSNRTKNWFSEELVIGRYTTQHFEAIVTRDFNPCVTLIRTFYPDSSSWKTFAAGKCTALVRPSPDCRWRRCSGRASTWATAPSRPFSCTFSLPFLTNFFSVKKITTLTNYD